MHATYLLPCWQAQYIFEPKCSVTHQRKASLLDPVLELGREITRARIILEALRDLLKFGFGDSLALLSVTLHVFGSDKGIKRLSLLFHTPHYVRLLRLHFL